MATHDELRTPEVQEVLREWVDAHAPESSPVMLCAHVVKAMMDASAFCLSHAREGQDLRPGLRTCLGVPTPKRPAA